MSAAATTGRAGRPGVMLVVRDVTAPARAEERLRFLAAATEVLGESLDHEATLGSVARLSVPTLADWCIVDDLREDGSIDPVAHFAASPAKQELLEELRDRYTPTWDSPQPAARALRSGETVLFPELPREVLLETIRDEGRLDLISRLEPS